VSEARGLGGLGRALAIASLLAAGALSWTLALRPPLRVDAAPLAALPLTVGEWAGADVSMTSAEVELLRADHHVQRLYARPPGETLWLYVGYYGTARGGVPEHTPEACYAAAGFGIVERRGAGGGPAARELLVEQGGARQLVHYWFRSYRRSGLAGGLDRTLDHLAGRILEGRADGALVRLAAPLPPGDAGVEPARAALVAFATALDAQLAEHWPHERPEGADAR
jgi:EpsI family protein